MKLVDLLGWLVFGFFTVIFISNYGSHWDLSGRYHMPTTLLSPDGQTYRDGSPIDGVTLVLVNRGIEQEAWIVAAGVQLVLLVLLVRAMWRLPRMQLKAFDRELRRIYGMPHDGERG